MHFFGIISLEPQKNAEISIFLKIERKDISLQISLKFAFKYCKANIFIKILKLHGKWKHKNHCLCVVNNKIVCNSTFSISDSLPLVQLKYSLNNFCPQPETNDALTGLATSIS